MHTFSQEAIERPRRSLQAAEVLRQKAQAISRATLEAREDEVIVAVIQHDLSFGGVWTLARESLTPQIHIVEDTGGWSFIFSPNTSATQVEERCSSFAQIASKRHKAMQKWVGKHA
jgi:hypothetical protein